MSIGGIGHTGGDDEPWRPPWAHLTGVGGGLVVIVVAVVILLADGYVAARHGRVETGVPQWIPGMADGLPYRPPAHVRPKAVHDWSPAAPGRAQIYTDFHVGSGEPPEMSLLLPVVEGQPGLFVNGIPIEAPGPVGARYQSQPGRSVIWDIPAHFLRPGSNRIDIVVTRPGRRTLTAPLVLGRRDGSARLNNTLTALTEAFRGYLPGLSLLAAALALAAGAALRTSTPWVALAAAAAAGGARPLASEAFVRASLGPFWPLIDQLTLTAALFCLGCAILEPRVQRSTRVRRSLAAALGIFIGLAGLCAWGMHQGAQTSEVAGLGLPLLGMVFLIWACADASRGRPSQPPRAQALEGGVLGMLALATASAVVMSSEMAWGLWVPALETAYGLSLSALLGGLAILSAVLVTREIWRWARDRPRLGRIIRSQREEIEATSLALQQQVKRSAVLEERQRLSRDMHDGIGGQLMSLLARVRSGRISRDQLEGELTSGLSELRLMVDSLDASEGTVADALAVLRSRIRIQTEAAGITLDWSQAGDLNIVARDPRWILNLNRLIQEAATNAVRHSGGDRIGVSVEATDDGRFTVTVTDDGVGFDRDKVRPGRGLSNLAFRAAQLGGGLEIGSAGSGSGTIVRAVVALPRTLPDDPSPDHSSGEMIPS